MHRGSKGPDWQSISYGGDAWLRELPETIHPVVDERHKDSDVPIKLAIIDSGTDGKHPFLKDLFQIGQIV